MVKRFTTEGHMLDLHLIVERYCSFYMRIVDCLYELFQIGLCGDICFGCREIEKVGH